MAIVSFAVSIATGKVGARYAAMMFMMPGVYASYVVGLAWVSNTLPRPAAKVSDFFFSFHSFSLSNSGRGKKKKKKKKEGRSLVSDECVLLVEEKAGFCCKN